MRFQNPPIDDIKVILAGSKRIAVVGLSPKPERPSHTVAKALQGFGYQVVPVRPGITDVLGEVAYPSLLDVPGEIDIVEVFRNPAKIAPIVDACITKKVPILWLQDGVVNEAEANRAQQAGIKVIMDRCMYRDYVQFGL